MKECDLIMKGGIASGVVYSGVVSEISQHYRLCGVGGTSAGAIAAVLASAAEYRRQASGGTDDWGFQELGRINAEIGPDLKNLFQPSDPMKAFFNIAISAIETKGALKLLVLPVTIILQYYILFIVVACVGVGLFCWLGGEPYSSGFWVAIAVSLFLAFLACLFKLGYTAFKRFPVNRYGMCPGLSQSNAKTPGLTVWLDDKIKAVSGKGNGVLTVADLKAHGISLATMTTDLSAGRPYQLPLMTDIFLFSEAEFRELFPAEVVDYLVLQGRPYTGAKDEATPNDLVWLISKDKFPVLLTARMSLSFPMLIQTVPLYRFDDTLPKDSLTKIAKCQFSDGGISSNFPVHFFDSLIPERPTFGITLGVWDKSRHGDKRIAINKATPPARPPIRPVTSLSGFIGAIFNTAKDWQDTLQSGLVGYAERNVEILLNDDEGGLNLTMPPEMIEKLGLLGQEAAKALLENFNWNDHRNRRSLTILENISKSAQGFQHVFDQENQDDGALSLSKILTEFQPTHYNNTPNERAKLLQLAQAFAALANQDISKAKTPKNDARLRLQADADRSPR